MRNLRHILKAVAEDSGHAVRSVHAKSHGILEGVLRIDAALPGELAQSLFATAGEHKVFMRLSTNAGDILPDAVSLPRGLAIKVLDVPGERLLGQKGSNADPSSWSTARSFKQGAQRRS